MGSGRAVYLWWRAVLQAASCLSPRLVALTLRPYLLSPTRNHAQVRRKDWLESMIHHWATVGLLAYSYYVNFTRVGVMILLVHDASDIFLEAAKLARWFYELCAV